MDAKAARAQGEFLAMQIREDLAAAGLPIADEHDVVGATSGAWVEGDGDETGVWVSVTWAPHFVVSVVSREEHARLQMDGPGGSFSLVVHDAMRQAMATILEASGYEIDDVLGDARPGSVLLVTGHHKAPSWRDWHEKQKQRRSGIQQRLLNARTRAVQPASEAEQGEHGQREEHGHQGEGRARGQDHAVGR